MTLALGWPAGSVARLTGVVLFASAGSVWATASTQTLVCDVAYLPSRANWVRTVTVDYDDKRLRRVSVDGVAVHTFSVYGTVILTSQDNERIQVDVAELGWTSDFRGLATGQGRCQRGNM